MLKIIIKTNKNIKFNLLYDQNNSLQKKIKIEQLRREIYWYFLIKDKNFICQVIQSHFI